MLSLIPFFSFFSCSSPYEFFVHGTFVPLPSTVESIYTNADFPERPQLPLIRVAFLHLIALPFSLSTTLPPVPPVFFPCHYCSFLLVSQIPEIYSWFPRPPILDPSLYPVHLSFQPKRCPFLACLLHSGSFPR